MDNLKKLNHVCWVLGIVTGVVMVVMALMGVWTGEWGPSKLFLTALILFVAAGAMIILNNAIMRFTIRAEEERKAVAPPQPPASSE